MTTLMIKVPWDIKEKRSLLFIRAKNPSNFKYSILTATDIHLNYVTNKKFRISFLMNMNQLRLFSKIKLLAKARR